MNEISLADYAGAYYDQSHYRRLRPFVVDVLGKRAGEAATRENDSRAAAEMMECGDLTSAEYAAACLLSVISAPASHVTEPDAIRSAAADLARYLPEEIGARLVACVESLPVSVIPEQSPAAARSKIWTPERKAAARDMLAKLKAGGIRDFTAQTAKHFGVTASRLRKALED